MKRGAVTVRVAGALAILLVGLGPAWAGKAETDGKPPTSGSSAGSGWNPSFTCVVETGETLDELFECLADGIEHPPGNPCPPGPAAPPTTLGDGGPPVNLELNPPGPDDCSDPNDRSDFRVTRLPWPEYGIRILRLDGSEIDRLYFWENDRSIQRTVVEVVRPGLAARIGMFVEQPSRPGGLVTVTLDGIPVVVDTSRFRKASELTQELLLQLRRAGFDARVLDDRYLVVVTDMVTGLGITRLEFESGDPAIRSSDLALIPVAELLPLLDAHLLH